MADRRKKSWGTFKNEMKAKRRKTGDGGAKKNEKGNILERQELVVQRLSSEVSGEAQKYTRVRPREFVQYDEEELSIEGIKAACEKHFSSSLERKRLFCDVLAGEQGPSCHSMKHIPDLKVIHVRSIKSSSTPAHLQLQTLPFEGEETRRYSPSRMNKHPVQKLIHLAWQASPASSYRKWTNSWELHVSHLVNQCFVPCLGPAGFVAGALQVH